jgi:hypothetical protein
MTATATVNLADVAARWRLARRLYPIYSALDRQFELGVGPCRDLEIPINRSEPEVLERVARWFDTMDPKIQVWQLRQLLQISHMADSPTLLALLKRQLAKPAKDAGVRDKVDYLFVQYYAECAPEDAHNSQISLAHVAEVLQHVVGDVDLELPAAAQPLAAILADLEACKGLGDLLARQIIERAREVKNKVGDDYFKPAVLCAFVRFNFIVRMGFFRLMHADLHATRHAIHQMEQRGQQSCDCSSAGLSANESFVELRRICHEWKRPFRAAYSAGNNFKQLVAVRAAVETAVEKPAPVPSQPAVPTPVAAAPAPQPARVAVSPSAVPPPAAPMIGSVPTIEGYLEKIAEQLLNAPANTASVSNVMMGQTKLLLASWEVMAFTRGGDDVSDALQRAVSARAILSICIERKKKKEAADLKAAIGIAHAEAALMQERIAEAKDAKNIDAAVNLAATHKRLLNLIAEAEKLQ